MEEGEGCCGGTEEVEGDNIFLEGERMRPIVLNMMQTRTMMIIMMMAIPMVSMIG